ncbi:MAG TPA: hypothetical protein VNQ73_11115 [Ilumatobacter sp.]|nr:hypothetical protein [Ilumatobacter sp.]
MGIDAEPRGRLALTHFPIERAAASLVAHRSSHTALVVVVRPDQIDATVIAHDDHIGLRAAVRVAATAGNHRAWRNLGPWVERIDVGSLPAVINLAAKRDRIRACHLGGIYVGERMAAVALWFTRRERDTAAAQAYRNDTFAVLRVAAAPSQT